jgi:anti-sigma factor RsiW
VNEEKRVPDWMWERYLLDELPGKKRRQLEKLLEQDPALRAELERMRLSDRQILSSYPPERVIPEILKRAALDRPRPESTRRWRLAWVAAPVLALAVFLLLILPPLLQRRLVNPGEARPEDYVGMKGDGVLSRAAARLQLYRRSGDGSEQLQDGSPARAGDRLQVAFFPGKQTHGVILSIDGAGAVTLHFPDKTEGDTALPGGSRVFLPRSYELDEAPLFERFFFITAQAPLPTAAILEKARALAADRARAMTGDLDLPGGCKQFSLLIRK